MARKSYRYALTHAFVRILWKPRVGDPVLLRDAGGTHRLTIERIKPGNELYLSNGAGPFFARQLFYRSPPAAVREVFEKLRPLCEYASEESPGRWIAGIRIHGVTMVLKGRTVRIVAQLLDLRALDIRINQAVNRIASEAAPKRGALSLVSSDQKESTPE